MADTIDSFIDEEFLKKLEKLKIATKRGLKGPDKGEHRALQIGEGLEFLDYRKYNLGDDLRYVDWSVYGRLDKLFIKLFHAEENQNIHILLDMSRSMGWGNSPKYIAAKKIAAAVSYMCLSNLDKVSIGAFSDRILEINPPMRSKRRYSQILDFLRVLEPDGRTRINACLSEYASLCSEPGIIVIVSDLLDEKGFQDGLMSLKTRHFDTHLIQVLDHEEISWSERGNLLLRELETGEEKQIHLDGTLLQLYREKVNDFISSINTYCDNCGISFYLHDTGIPFEDFLIDYVVKGYLFR